MIWNLDLKVKIQGFFSIKISSSFVNQPES